MIRFEVELLELGRRMRKLRLERRMTLKRLQEASTLSATHLSEIERGRTSPTIGALIRIARALGREPSYFIEHEERTDVARVSRGQGAQAKLSAGITAEVLSPGIPGSEISAYRLRFESHGGELRLRSPETPAEVCYFVTRGVLEASVGAQHASLAAGDAIQATTRDLHRIRLASSGTAEAILILDRTLEEILEPGDSASRRLGELA